MHLREMGLDLFFLNMLKLPKWVGMYTFYTYYCGLKISEGTKYYGPLYSMCVENWGGLYVIELLTNCW